MSGGAVAEKESLVDVVAEALGVPRERAKRLLESRSTRLMRYRGLRYLVLRRDVAGHYEGTVIFLFDDGSYRVVEGYPHISRVLLLSRAMPRHFPGEVIVEEKMDGHNVRVVKVAGQVLALTRGGYVCPYTTMRMRMKYGGALERLFEEVGDDAVVAGEVVGLENPYTRHYYPEAPDWDYFVFDVFVDNGRRPLPVARRRELVEALGLRGVPQLAIVHRDDWETVREIIAGLEEAGREGVVLKDPEYRVPPLKYTTGYINVRDIREGMRFPFDEGHTFIFARVLRQMFKAYEEGWDEERLREEARRIGEAILLPAVESIYRFVRGETLGEEFILTFDSMESLEEFILYAAQLGVPISVVSTETSDGLVKARMVKHKKTPEEYRKIMRTGLSPLD